MTKKRRTLAFLVALIGGFIIGLVSGYSLGLWGLIACIPMSMIWGALCGEISSRGIYGDR